MGVPAQADSDLTLRLPAAPLGPEGSGEAHRTGRAPLQLSAARTPSRRPPRHMQRQHGSRHKKLTPTRPTDGASALIRRDGVSKAPTDSGLAPPGEVAFAPISRKEKQRQSKQTPAQSWAGGGRRALKAAWRAKVSSSVLS